jgi:hypothetical protein
MGTSSSFEQALWLLVCDRPPLRIWEWSEGIVYWIQFHQAHRRELSFASPRGFSFLPFLCWHNRHHKLVAKQGPCDSNHAMHLKRRMVLYGNRYPTDKAACCSTVNSKFYSTNPVIIITKTIG